MDPRSVAGPSRQTLPLRRADPSASSTNRLTSKPRKRPAKLALAHDVPIHRPGDASPGSRSVPASPILGESHDGGSGAERAMGDGRTDLRDTLCGAPRRRPSVLFTSRTPALPSLNIPSRVKPSISESSGPASGPPAIWQDPSEHILSGNGASLQHARSVYANGPVEVLPGIFLGDEFNACDEPTLVRLGITTILNVAKETTLPYQKGNAGRAVGFLRQSFQTGDRLANGLHSRLTLNDEVSTPTTSTRPRQVSQDGALTQSDAQAYSPPSSGVERETFRTPMTSMPFTLPSPPNEAPSSSRPTSFYLRNTSSTPNLHVQYLSPDSVTDKIPGAYQASPIEEATQGQSTDTVSPLPPQLGLLNVSSPHTPSPRHVIGEDSKERSPSEASATTPGSSTFSRGMTTLADLSIASSASPGTTSSSAESLTIPLPRDAIALDVPPSSHSRRTWPIRYVKLPWTHSEANLANPNATGGFVTGCAIIADAIGLDLQTGRRTLRSPGERSGGILVHCQCGVSRSATLLIAFVMQAAAYQYDFEAVHALTGMHDCYDLVKEHSSTISPNITLIFQLVEWERMLSEQVARLSAAAVAAAGTTVSPGDTATLANGLSELAGPVTAPLERRWGKEVLDEEDWMRMRAEEEEKERAEAEENEKRMADVRAREAEWRATQQGAPGRMAAPALTVTTPAGSTAGGTNLPSTEGLGARRKKPSPSLKLVGSAKTGIDRALPPLGVKTSLGLVPTIPEVTSKQLSEPPTTPMAAESGAVDSSMHSKAPSVFPWLRAQKASGGGDRPNDALTRSLSSQSQASQGSSTGQTTSRPNSGYGAAAFGALGQSAAERRIKHKRTFSAEVPDWTPGQASMRHHGHTIGNSGPIGQRSTLSTASTLPAPGEEDMDEGAS